MGKKIIRVLTCSICGILAFCIVVFMVMINHMQDENETTMREVCQLFMSEMSDQIQAHFHSEAELRLDMEEVIIKHLPPETALEYSDEFVEELASTVQMCNYDFAALYSETGELDVVYGNPFRIVNELPFRQSLLEGQEKLVAGVAEDTGDVILLYGIQASYPMKNGERSIALVVGIPISNVNQALSLAEDDSLVYSHIIRKDGSFVLQNDNNNAENYYDWLLAEAEFEDKKPQQAVDELKNAVQNGQDYSIIVTVDGQRRNIYCEPLKKTEWVLVTVMLHGTLDTAVYDLGQEHLRDAVISCAVIFLVLISIFVLYLRFSLRQMKRLEVAQQAALQASKAKSAFLSNMSHDIRTPMNAIVGMTSIASANINKPEVVEDCLRKVTLSSRHLLGLINDVLDMSKIESGKLTLNIQEISLRDTFENIVNICTPQIKGKNQNFDVFIHNIQSENVFCDDVRLNQVLINLLSNAIKFTPDEGSIYVTLAQEDSPLGEKYVRNHIRVKDSGIGMSEEFALKIFDSFSREENESVRHTEGTGLGMAITKYIIDEMRGTIEVQSEQGVGTEFHVTVDLEKAPVEEGHLQLEAQEMLVVDDDEQMCVSTVENLKGLGVHAEWAQSGETAIEMVKERHRDQRDYHAVLLDLKMDGMDGIETARRMREEIGTDLPILMISAYDWSDVEDEARSAGITGFIPKPLFKSTLYHALNHYLGEETEQQTVETEQLPYGENQRLLVAEDYDMNWEVLETLLPEYGFMLERAENGQICVDMFNASAEGYYAAVLMDVRMPVMSGYDATKAIRASGRADAGLPIIAMTADAFSDDIRRCLECGMNAHVAKPIDMRELLNALKKFLQGAERS